MGSIDEHARAGLLALEEKRFEDAVEAFRKAIALDPSRPDMHNALAMAHLHRGDTANALEPLGRAVELAEPYDAPEHQPLKREFHLSLASVLQLLDRFEDARRVLEGAVERWPGEPAPALRLAQLLALGGEVREAEALWRGLGPHLEGEDARAIDALLGALEAFRASGEDASLFLRAHQGSYREYFDAVADAEAHRGWYAEAARMARGPDGEPVAVVADGARPYALTRVDLVNPDDGTVSSVYSDTDPMIVAVQGLEPLAQVPILLPWRAEPYLVLVSTQCPWHWLTVSVQLRSPDPERVQRVDELLGSWYLRGFNGDFGEADAGRFHYVSDPEPVGERAVSWVVDLGRARFEAVEALLEALDALHAQHPIDRVVFGQGRLPA